MVSNKIKYLKSDHMGTNFFKRSYFIVLGVLSFATTEHFNDSATLLKQPIHSFGCLRFIWNIVTNASARA
jgi:hypothetical protein